MKRAIIFSVLLLGPIVVSPVLAVDSTRSGRSPLKATRAAEIKDLRENLKSRVASVRAELKNKIEAWKGKFVHLTDATVIDKTGNVLTITKDGKTYTVNVDSNTKFRRHYWGVSSLDEVSVGNKINVWGKWTDDAKTTINALLIRNQSVMRRHGVFVGEIKSITGSTFVLKSVNRGDQTVTVDSTTKYLDRKEGVLILADLKVGQRVRVRGLWDKSLNTITEVTQVKDYSLPPQVTPAPTVSPVPTP